MKTRQQVTTRILASLFALFILPAGMVAAQDSTPVSGSPTGGYPVAVHEGTCDNPVAQPTWQLDNAVPIEAENSNAEIVGAAMERWINEASTVLDIQIGDLTDTPYVMAVHASSDDFGTIVACGPISGFQVNGQLVVALEEVNSSGVRGLALIDEDQTGIFNLGDDESKFTVYIVVPLGPAAATPVA